VPATTAPLMSQDVFLEGLRSLRAVPQLSCASLADLLSCVVSVCGSHVARRALRCALTCEMKTGGGGLARRVLASGSAAAPAPPGRSLSALPSVLLSHACAFLPARDMACFARVSLQMAELCRYPSSHKHVDLRLERRVAWTRLPCRRPSVLRLRGSTSSTCEASGLVTRVWDKVEHLIMHAVPDEVADALRPQTALRTLWWTPLSTARQLARVVHNPTRLVDVRVGTVDVQSRTLAESWGSASSLRFLECDVLQCAPEGLAHFDGWPRLEMLHVGQRGGPVHGGAVVRALEACVRPDRLTVTFGTTPLPSPAGRVSVIARLRALRIVEECGAQAHDWLRFFGEVSSVDLHCCSASHGPSIGEILVDVVVRRARSFTVRHVSPLRVNAPTNAQQTTLDAHAHTVSSVSVCSMPRRPWTSARARHLCDVLCVARHLWIGLCVWPTEVAPVWRTLRENLVGFRVRRLGGSSPVWQAMEADWVE